MVILPCLFAGRVQAQLSSDKPAMTEQQMKDLMQKRNAEATKELTVPVTPGISSSTPALTQQQSAKLVKTEKDAKVSDKMKPVSIPSQGVEKPLAIPEKPIELKLEKAVVEVVKQ